MNNYLTKQIDFKFGDYISQGFELFKKNIGNFVLAFIFTFIMSIIPLCGLLGMGNFYKYCRKVNNGEPATPSDIFNFDDFKPYLILNLIIIGFVIAFMIPYSIMIGMATQIGGESSPILGGLLSLLIFALVVVMYYFMLKGFYIPALISLEGKKDLKEAWNISKAMTKNNLLMIFLFALVVSFIGQIGIILCGIGILLTIPITYACNYMAFEDGLNQIKKDEIDEIGTVSH